MSGRFSFLLLGSALLLAGGVGDRSEGEYFPPPESEIGWRKNTDPEFVRSLGLDPQALEELGKFNLAVPNTSWRPYGDHKGTLVIKDGWIVGEWYNSAEAKEFRTYLRRSRSTLTREKWKTMPERICSGNTPMPTPASASVISV